MAPHPGLKFFDFDKTTWKMLAVCGLVTFTFGLLARVPSYEDKAVGVLSSLIFDGIMLTLAIPYVSAIMRSRFNELNLTTIGVTVLVSVLCGFIVVGGTMLVTRAFPATANVYQNRPFMVAAYFTLVFCIWGLAAFSLKTHRLATEEAVNAAKAEQAAAVSELKRLRMQLDPHFLFNALNTAVVEIPHRPKRAVLMLRELTNYLRYSLDTADVQVVPVSAELAMIRSFLRVQDIRFGAKLKHTITAHDDAKRRLLPAFLLQPLIENAAKYGIPDDDNILRIDVVVALNDDDLVITVSNTGELTVSKPDQWGTRTGLSNLQSRLALHYPDRHSFEMVQAGRNVCVTCILRGEPC